MSAGADHPHKPLRGAVDRGLLLFAGAVGPSEACTIRSRYRHPKVGMSQHVSSTSSFTIKAERCIPADRQRETALVKNKTQANLEITR